MFIQQSTEYIQLIEAEIERLQQLRKPGANHDPERRAV